MSEKKKTILRLILSLFVIGALILLGYFIFKALGFTDMTREELQKNIASTGALAPLIFIVVSFLQVTFVPIPGAVTIIAGNYLFGPWLSFLYSYIGMIAGALFAFGLGRWIGRPYINWVAGSKEKANEWIKKLKGRETVFLFFAFLLPLFPDDLLCSVAGILPISLLTFTVMQLITRLTSIGATLIFMSGELIPYHGWGLVVIAVLVAICVTAFILSLKYADKLNTYFNKLVNKITEKLKIKKKGKEK